MSATSLTFVPTATSTVISQVTNIIPQRTLFVPCTIGNDGTPSNDVSTGVSDTSVHVPSGHTQDNNSDSSNTNHAAIIGSVVAVVVTLSLSVIGFFMWTLWKKNRAMKAALEEHEREEDEVNMSQFLPTPYLVSITSSPVLPLLIRIDFRSLLLPHRDRVPQTPLALLHPGPPVEACCPMTTP
jgi:hypothetical protein